MINSSLKFVIVLFSVSAFFMSSSMEDREGKKQKTEIRLFYQPKSLVDIVAGTVGLLAIAQESPAAFLAPLPEELKEKVVTIPVDNALRTCIHYAQTDKQAQEVYNYWALLGENPPRDILLESPEDFAKFNGYSGALEFWTSLKAQPGDKSCQKNENNNDRSSEKALAYHIKNLRVTAAQDLIEAGAHCTIDTLIFSLTLKFNNLAQLIASKIESRALLKNKLDILATLIEHNLHEFNFWHDKFQSMCPFSEYDVHLLLLDSCRFNYKAIEILMSMYTVDINRCDDEGTDGAECGYFPLGMAAAHNTASLQHLISLGALINTDHNASYTALESAIINKNYENTVVLLQAGADVSRISQTQSIIQFAIEHNIESLLNIFKYSKQKIDITDKGLNPKGVPFIVQLAKSDDLGSIKPDALKRVLILLEESIPNMNEKTINEETGDEATLFDTYFRLIHGALNDFGDEDYKGLFGLIEYLFQKGLKLNQATYIQFLELLETKKSSENLNTLIKLLSTLRDE